MTRRLKRRLAGAGREDGITIIIAIEVLAVMLLLVGAVVAGAMQLNSTTKRDTNAKRALAGAEAGLQVARYRLNRITPPNTWCLTDRKAGVGTGGAAAGECPYFSGDLGNGVTYKYWVTDTAQGAQCGGVSTGSNRCITVTGTSGRVTRRIRALVGHTPEQYFFNLAGIIGYDGVKLGNGTGTNPVIVNGALGSDSQIDLGNNDFVNGGCVVTANGSVHYGNNDQCVQSSPNPPLACTPATFKQCATSINVLPWATTLSANMNATGMSSAPGAPGNWTYTAGTVNGSFPTGNTRTLTSATPESWIVLQSGDYNFCKWTLSNNTLVLLASASTTVRLFFDSSKRSPAGCSTFQSVPIKLGNGATLNSPWSGNPAPQPEQLQIYIYGEPGQSKATTTADLANANIINANLYAPNSLVTMGNGASPTSNSVWNGAVNAQEADIGNLFTYNWDPDSANINTGVNRFARSAWVECRSAPTTSSDPESGC